LKRIFYILIFLIGLNFTSSAQNKTADPVAKLIKFYPNPAYAFINFDFQRGYDKSFTFQVYNSVGKMIYENKNPTPRINLPLDEFYRGVYLYLLRDKNGVIAESDKFQVVK
jgi:hypothetical protein